MRLTPLAALGLLLAALPAAGAPSIERVWLTHRSADPSKIVVNWETSEPCASLLEYGTTAAVHQSADTAAVTLHHLEVPMEDRAPFCYRIHTGETAGPLVSCAGYPAGQLRVAVVGDIGYAPTCWATAVAAQKPHLLITAGDNVPALHGTGPVAADDVTAFRKLIDSAPELFAVTPFMPALGNHDRELRARGPKPPEEPVYDVEATAFRRFFPLPEPGWHWSFDLKRYGVRFLAADLSHLSDQGTTWQTCHSPAVGGEQDGWLTEALTTTERPPLLVTLYNERNSTVRGLNHGEMGKLLARSSVVITGFGYFAERAESGGRSFYNTALSGRGAVYADPASAFVKSEDNFLLLTLAADVPQLSVQILNLQGEVLEAKVFPGETSFR